MPLTPRRTLWRPGPGARRARAPNAPGAEAFPTPPFVLQTATATANAVAFASLSGGSTGGVLQPGVRYYGVCGHLDQGGIYQSVSYANQAADIKDIFGSTPNTVLYRAFGDARAFVDVDTDVRAFQALDIIPVVTAFTYPNWPGYANEAAAYAAAYADVAALCAAAPTIELFEIGNEWNLQIGDAPGGNDGEDVADWTGIASYPLFRGAHAGALKAIRDNALPHAQVIGGPTSGWVKTGFVPALANDLYTIYGLEWDFTCNHWYNGEFVNGFNLPDNVAGTGGNSYSTMRPATAPPKPLLFTELGASIGGGSSEATAASRITGLLDNIYAQGVSGSGSELGTIGAILFELYPHGVFTDYYLRDTSRVIETQGTAVKNWIAAHP